MALEFDKYTREGNEFVEEVAKKLGSPEIKDHAERMIVATFGGLRRTITPDESFDLISQLPMYLKAVYVDGWKLSQSSERVNTGSDFIQKVRDSIPLTAERDLGNDQEAQKKVQAVLSVLKEKYVSEGEFSNIEDQMPETVAQMVREA